MPTLHETHYIAQLEHGGGRLQLAVCGALINIVKHDGEPSCAVCREWLAADAAEAAKYPTVAAHAEALFGAPDPDARPVFARDPSFEPLRGYRPKGAR